MIEKVFIVFFRELIDEGNHYIESVWSTKALANSAIHYHAKNSQRKLNEYSIIERDIDKAHIR